MDLKDIQERARVSMEAIKQMQIQEKILEDTINETLKNAPEEAKQGINDFRNLFRDVKALAKSGDMKQAEELMKNFNYANKNNK